MENAGGAERVGARFAPDGLTIDPHDPWHVVQQGYTALVTHPDGSLTEQGRGGLWDYDTRILSRYEPKIAGQPPRYVSGGIIGDERWAARLRVPRAGGTPQGPGLPEDALELFVMRLVGRGMVERLLVVNHSMLGVETELSIELGADFRDVQEIGRDRMQCGETETIWSAEPSSLVIRYRAEHRGRSFERALRVRVGRSDGAAAYRDGGVRFPLRIAARGRWTAVLSFDSWVDGEWRRPLAESPGTETERDHVRAAWQRTRARVDASDPSLARVIERAANDLFALRNWEFDEAVDAWHTKAGAPTYSGIFGRDSLTAAWQGSLLGSEMLRGTLPVIARTQAGRDSAWNDEEPGKMIHEIRRGPLSELEIIPQRRYYGTQTTPAMFVLALSEAWHWTGDDGLLRRYRDAAMRSLDWAERYGDRDGDGFLEYVRRSPKGLKNQGWKDSDEAIRYADGRLVPDPIATVEEQAYHFIALQRMAEILVVLGEDAGADAMLAKARRLRQRFEEAFWAEEASFYAMALDPDKRPVLSIGSNPGHALGSGIVRPDRARRVADRLLAPDLFSGWGVRTLSTEHPSYNAFAYHLGTVWPVENATFALGMKRYGLDAHAERIFEGMISAATYFQGHRLPEALSGHDRDETPIPSAYPGSNSPQAWSASAVIQLVQIMLGLYPFAPARALLLVRPRLPPWLATVTVRRVRVGDGTVSIRFERRDDGSVEHDVVERDGRMRVWAAPPPQDLAPEAASRTDHLKEWLLEHAPGRRARAARLALGDLEQD